MINKNLNTVIDFGKSNIKVCTFDDKKKIISYGNESMEFSSEDNSSSLTLKKIIRQSEKQISNHIDGITLLIDHSKFFTIDLSIKKNLDHLQLAEEIQKTAFLECSQIINNSNQKIKIINYFINKITIDQQEVNKLPENLRDNSSIIFNYKLLCLPDEIFFKITNIFKENNIVIKKIFCSSIVRSASYLNHYKDKKYVAFLDIGFNRSSLILYKHKKLVYINNIAIGGHNITKDISSVMSLGLDESEKIKKKFNELESDFSFLNEENNGEKIIKHLIKNKISIDLLKKIILARVEELFNLIFEDLKLHNRELSKNELYLVLIGNGSKLLNKNTFKLENIQSFKDIFFYDENDKDICKLGLENNLENLQEIEKLRKIQKKQGIFERFFNLFDKI